MSAEIWNWPGIVNCNIRSGKNRPRVNPADAHVPVQVAVFEYTIARELRKLIQRAPNSNEVVGR
ncbi:MAG: hypothetical protein ACI9BW_003561 [Gammaproteobacteria bacterium]|jgi:hypothetical protein